MQLIINYPTDEIGINNFNKAFSQVQKELVLMSIKNLNVDINSREKILCLIAKVLKEQTKKEIE